MFARISTVHVPPSNVAEAFDLLAESMPDLEHMEELLSYSKHIYVQGRRRRGRRNNLMDPHFSLSIHGNNCTLHLMVYRAYTNQRLRRMTAVCKALLQCSHPTMWRLFEGIRSDCSTFGKGYRTLLERVVRTTWTYGPTDVLYSYGTHISSEKLAIISPMIKNPR